MKRTTLATLNAYLAEHAPAWVVDKINLFDGSSTYLMKTTNMVNSALQMYTGTPSQLLVTARSLLEPRKQRGGAYPLSN